MPLREEVDELIELSNTFDYLALIEDFWDRAAQFLVDHQQHALLIFSQRLYKLLDGFRGRINIERELIHEVVTIITKVRQKDPGLADKLLTLDPLLPIWMQSIKSTTDATQ